MFFTDLSTASGSITSMKKYVGPWLDAVEKIDRDLSRFIRLTAIPRRMTCRATHEELDAIAERARLGPTCQVRTKRPLYSGTDFVLIGRKRVHLPMTNAFSMLEEGVNSQSSSSLSIKRPVLLTLLLLQASSSRPPAVVESTRLSTPRIFRESYWFHAVILFSIRYS